MASAAVLEAQKHQALAEAIQTTHGLLGEESARLHSAQHDVVGRTDTSFVFAMLVAELSRVVASQQERIERLEASLEASATPAKKPGK